MFPLHLGGLHPYELVLTLVLALGPLLLLAMVVAVRRRAGGPDQRGRALLSCGTATPGRPCSRP